MTPREPNPLGVILVARRGMQLGDGLRISAGPVPWPTWFSLNENEQARLLSRGDFYLLPKA